jgi:hypothetical protein
MLLDGVFFHGVFPTPGQRRSILPAGSIEIIPGDQIPEPETHGVT